MLPIECVVRGYLAGSGWKDYQATGEVCGHRLPAGMQESERLPEPIFTPATKAEEGHDENIDRERAAELVGAENLAEAERLRSRSTASPPTGRASGGSSSPTRSSSSASTRTAGSCSATRCARPTRRASGPPTSTRPAAASRRSTSSSCATTASRSAGTRRAPGPELPDDVVAGTRARYVEAFELLTGITLDAYIADPSVVQR